MTFYKIYTKIIKIIAIPSCLAYFFKKDVGRDYGVGFITKLKVILRFRKNSKSITSATSWREHLFIAAEILKIPSSVKGDVIECGCYKGGSSANLSLICDIVGRKLVLCDSFEGLPALEEPDRVHYNIFSQHVRKYEKGDFAGELDEVKHNISKYGKISVCIFVKGYYEVSLRQLDGSYVLVFLDVDLYKSLRECLTSLWPGLVNGCYLFTHEAQDMAFVSIFFDRQWWQENLNCQPPGLVGAGSGLPLGIGEGSGLGYAVKGSVNSSSENWGVVSFSKK